MGWKRKAKAVPKVVIIVPLWQQIVSQCLQHAHELGIAFAIINLLLLFRLSRCGRAPLTLPVPLSLILAIFFMLSMQFVQRRLLAIWRALPTGLQRTMTYCSRSIHAPSILGRARDCDVLISIPYSHYCEKVRWALDRSGIPYKEVVVAPMFLRLTAAWHSCGTSLTVPLMVTKEGEVLTDSCAMLAYIAAKHQQKWLYPGKDAARWEKELGDSFGRPCFHVVYYYLLNPESPVTSITAAASTDDDNNNDGGGDDDGGGGAGGGNGGAAGGRGLGLGVGFAGTTGFVNVKALRMSRLLAAFTRGCSWGQSAFTQACFPALRVFLNTGLKLEAKLEDNLTKVEAAFERVSKALTLTQGESGGGYICGGDKPSAADITFAALAFPVLLPQEARHLLGITPTSPGLHPDYRDLVQRLTDTPAGELALRMWAQERCDSRHHGAKEASNKHKHHHHQQQHQGRGRDARGRRSVSRDDDDGGGGGGDGAVASPGRRGGGGGANGALGLGRRGRSRSPRGTVNSSQTHRVKGFSKLTLKDFFGITGPDEQRGVVVPPEVLEALSASGAGASGLGLGGEAQAGNGNATPSPPNRAQLETE